MLSCQYKVNLGHVLCYDKSCTRMLAGPATLLIQHALEHSMHAVLHVTGMLHRRCSPVTPQTQHLSTFAFGIVASRQPEQATKSNCDGQEKGW